MTGQSEDAAAARGRERVLLLVCDDDARERLATWLEGSYRVGHGRPDDSDAWNEFDACVVDAALYPRVAESLAASRAEAGAYLPVLLLVPRDRRNADWVDEALADGGAADDVLPVPTREARLRARLRSLLRARRYSRELEAQRERLQLFRRTMDEASVGAVITDPDREDNPIVYANDRFCELTGYDREEVLGRNPRFLQGPRSDPESVAEMREAVDTGESVTVEVVNYRRDGSAFWNRVTIAPVRNAGGEVTHYVGFQEDVTGRVEGQRERELFRTLLDHSRDAVYVVDPETGRFVDSNETGHRRLGYGREELLGMSVLDIEATLQDRADWRDHVEAVREVGSRVGDGEHRRADGSTFPVEVAITYVEVDDPYLLVVARDVTERRQRELELERYETILEAAPDPIYALDEEGRYTLVNNAFEGPFDSSREDLVGSHPTELFDDTDIDSFRELVDHLRTSDEDQGTMEVSLDVGTERRLYEVNVALLTHEGEFQGTVGVARDITDLREHEHRLTVLDRVLRHNLKNKMNVVLAQAAAVEEAADDPVLADRATSIRRAGEDLLDLSEAARRFENTIDPERGEAHPQDVAGLARTIVGEASDDYPDATIEADLPSEGWALAPQALELALEELVVNAIEHNDRVHPDVDVEVTIDAETVTVRVSDDGPGFTDLERRALLRGVEGPLEHTQGLGLWLVRWVVTGAGGDLDIAGGDPRGSIVTVELPRAEEESEAEREPE